MRLGYIVGVLVGLCACEPAGHRSVRSELRERSARFGLALVEVRGERIAVIPFEGTAKDYRSEYPQPLTEAFGRAGRMIAWHPTSLWELTDFIVTSMDGKVIVKRRAPSRDFSPVAMNEQAGLLLFYGTLPGEHRQGGLHWATLDLSTIGFIDSLKYGEQPFGDWSPDGRMVAYSQGGMVYLFDMHSQRSTALVRGRDPTWAPGGRWISFRGQDERAALVTIQGVPVHWPLSSHRPLSPLLWSPDGQYVSYSEAAAFPVIGQYYRSVISRVSDGETITARSLGVGYPDLFGFHWILDYRLFCSHYRPE